MSFCPNGPRLELQTHDALMGEESHGDSFSITLTAAQPGDEVVPMSETGEVMRYTVSDPGPFEAQGTLEAKTFL